MLEHSGLKKPRQRDNSDPQNYAFDRWTSGWHSPVPTTNQGTQELGFQRWFRFKEAFAPSFVKATIDSLPYRPTAILDPFGGSGTTALTCQFLGLDSITIEVNPFLADLIEAKLTDCDFEYFRIIRDRVLRSARKLALRPTELDCALPPSFVEPGIHGRFLFSRHSARKLLALRRRIQEVDEVNTRRLLQVALASILVECSNCYVNGKGRRYRSDWENREAPCAFDLFQIACASIAEDLAVALCRPTTKHKIYRGDSRDKLRTLRDKFDFCLFSPPYPNSFDYTDVYNIELWFLGYIQNPEDNRILRQSTLRSHVQVLATRSAKQLNSRKLKDVYRKLVAQRHDLWNRRIPEMVQDYFFDLTDVIQLLGSRMISGQQVGLVVGDSQYLDIHIPVAKILEQCASDIGFSIASTSCVRSMRSSAQQGGNLKLAESLVLLRKI